MPKGIKRKVNPTPKEVAGAMEAQAPINPVQPLTKASPFQRLAKVSRQMNTEATVFAKPEMLFNDNYRDGLESTPFYVSKAFEFESKDGYGHRIGLTITLINGNSYNIALTLKQGDQKRNGMLKAFETDSTPIGPLCLVKLSLPRGGKPYYDIQPYGAKTTDEIDIPFPTEDFDGDMPF